MYKQYALGTYILLGRHYLYYENIKKAGDWLVLGTFKKIHKRRPQIASR